jgi:hypothetical protein
MRVGSTDYLGNLMPATLSTCRVLTYGQDEALLKTRQSLLKTVGIQTDLSLNADEFLHCVISSKRNYDLFILCHSVPPIEQKAIVEAANGSDVEIYVLHESVLPDHFLSHVVRTLLQRQASIIERLPSPISTMRP